MEVVRLGNDEKCSLAVTSFPGTTCESLSELVSLPL